MSKQHANFLDAALDSSRKILFLTANGKTNKQRNLKLNNVRREKHALYSNRSCLDTRFLFV